MMCSAAFASLQNYLRIDMRLGLETLFRAIEQAGFLTRGNTNLVYCNFSEEQH